MGFNDGLLILFMLNGAQTSSIDRVGEQLSTLVGLLDLLRHTLRKKKKKKERIGIEVLKESRR